MEITELNGGCTPCAIQLKSGNLSFPSMDGVVWTDPTRKDVNLPDGPLYVERIMVDGIPMNLDTMVQIPYDTKLLSLFLEYSSWSNRENIYIDYKLDNAKEWTALKIELNGEIRFPNPGIGSHQIQIRKLNGFGYQNYQQIQFQFYIATPWFKKWWFYVLIIALTSGLITLFLRIRTNQLLLHQKKLEHLIDEKTHELKESYDQLEQNNSIKTRLISIISHDLVTPLKFLSMTGRRLAHHHDQIKPSQLEEILEEMSRTSDELHQLSTNILNWIKYKNDNDWLEKQPINLHLLIEEVSGILGPLANQQGVKLINEVPETVELNEYLDPLKIVLYNLLSNAIRYSQNSDVRFTFKTEGTKIVVGVKDQGTGMSSVIAEKIMAGTYHFSMQGNESKKGYGLGYMIIVDLVNLMGAELKIDTKSNEGTHVFIKL
jgi:signal transduction histidine kinase